MPDNNGNDSVINYYNIGGSSSSSSSVSNIIHNNQVSGNVGSFSNGNIVVNGDYLNNANKVLGNNTNSINISVEVIISLSLALAIYLLKKEDIEIFFKRLFNSTNNKKNEKPTNKKARKR